MRSMTGFGRSSGTCKSADLNVTLKSVNGRYLDVRLHMPRLFLPFENDIKKELSKTFERGTLEIHVARKSKGSSEKFIFNEALAKKWAQGFRKVSRAVKISADLDPSVLLSVPDLFRLEESEGHQGVEKKLLLQLLQKAAKSCVQERQREGLGLKKDIGRHILELEKLVKGMVQLRKKSVKQIQSRFRERYDLLLQNFDENDPRFAQELVVLIEKSDISEEIQRLETHISAIQKVIAQKGRLGKKLDFFAQELLREVNTIGSKSVAAAITQTVVDAKGAIEKYREQVQNIE